MFTLISLSTKIICNFISKQMFYLSFENSSCLKQKYTLKRNVTNLIFAANVHYFLVSLDWGNATS